ncbi:alkaline phosphatase D family protein, partial [uncultured Cyclobacterium sp.]|uniref:alkaline phosphatase D family protein n=1 Tax=uncultured Cyclobacterium sp. TaxID=453820 RepID=UPI0030EF7D5F
MASEENDFTVKFPVTGLDEGTDYSINWEAKSSEATEVKVEKGSFSTAPRDKDEVPVLLTTSTCQYFWSFDNKERGFHTYDSMGKLKPDFFVHTGDYIYYDKPGPLAKNIEKACHKWHAMNGWPSLRDFFKKVPIYMINDDHDLLKDDAYLGKGPYGDLTFQEGIKLWYENVPIEDKPYRTVRWGKDLQFWMVEGREYRSANDMEDGANKSIWGKEQIDWFTKSVEASDATFKLLFTATPVVGPDRERKKDN